MKNQKALAIVLAVCAFTVIVFFAANLATANTLPGELLYIDAQVNVFAPRLQQYQSNYLAANGEYYQSLGSHDIAPSKAEKADKTKKPTNQEAALDVLWDFTELPDGVNFSFSVDVYAGPSGNGYVLNIQTDVDGNLWARAISFGPETYRTEEWHKVIVEG